MRSPFKESISLKARHYPRDRIALVYGDKSYTWKELNCRINKLANGLRDLGIKKGDKVAMIFYNTPEFVETNFAIQSLGAVPVPVNYRYVASEMEYIINNSDAIFLIFDEIVISEVQKARLNLKKIKKYICFGKDIPSDMLNYEEIIQNYKKREIITRVKEEDICIICYTGGTTGRPKGVMLTYDNLLSNIESVINLLTTILPPVDELHLESYAKNEFQRRLLNCMDTVISSIMPLSKNEKLADKVICFNSNLTDITLTGREGKIKLFHGVPKKEDTDLLIMADLGEHIRDISSIIPLSYSPWGRLRLLPRLIWRFILGGIKMKGSHRLRWNLIRTLMKREKDEEILSILLIPPLFHMAGYIFLILWMALGGKLVLPFSKKFDAREVIELIANEKIRWTLMVPVLWKRILEYPDISKYNLSTLTIALSGGALFRGKYKKLLLKYFPNALVMDGFGQTEMSPLTTVKMDGDINEVKERSIGKFLASLEARIVNDKGEETEIGEVGELLYKGSTLMKGYYGDEQKTKEAIDEDGWFHSGDLAYRGEDGEIYIVERVKECIISGAEKIYPLEVEDVILENPKVDNVCVIGVPDEEWGSAVRAVVQLKERISCSEEEIINWCRGKIAGYKKPKSVIFVNEFPLTPVGKIRRAEIRKIYGS
ncbi:MAG: AMP-binding protein [Promethearchaeota archaeon]